MPRWRAVWPAKEGRRAAQSTLIAGVAGAELSLRADDELLAITERTLASREQSLKLARVRFDAGVAAEPELRSAESLAAAARAGLIALPAATGQGAERGAAVPCARRRGGPGVTVKIRAARGARTATIAASHPAVRS